MKETKYNILYNCFIIIHLIDNNLMLFINDYKLNLIKELNNYYKKQSPLFLLNMNNKELKEFCKNLILKMIK